MRYTDIHSTDLHVTPDSPISHTWRPAECRSPKTPTTGTRDNSICRTLAVEELLNYSRNCIHLYEENPMQDFWHEIPVLCLVFLGMINITKHRFKAGFVFEGVVFLERHIGVLVENLLSYKSVGTAGWGWGWGQKLLCTTHPPNFDMLPTIMLYICACKWFELLYKLFTISNLF